MSIPSSLSGRLAGLLYLALFPLVGILVAYIGFCDPDSCWHIAIGRWMVEHRQLPLADPFSSNIHSFVTVAAGKPIMQHEWLSDCMFYIVYAAAGAVGLLLLVTAISTLALIVLPGLLMLRSGTPRLAILLLLLATVPASLFRLWVRPEVFSFLYFSILVWLVHFGCRCSAVRFRFFVLATFLLSALWANCHALFVLGIFFVFFMLALSLIETVLTPGASRRIPGRLSLLACASLGGSLCNPWQGQLWLWVMRIVLSPQSHANSENGALTLSALGHITVVPLLVAFVLAAVYFLKVWRAKKPVFRALLGPLGMLLCSLLCAILFRRFTPIALIMLCAAVAELFARTTPVAFDFCEDILARLRLPQAGAAIVGIAMALVATLAAASYLVRPEIPSASRFFTPPCQALTWLSRNRPTGRLLNDSKIGSMMTFWSGPVPLTDIFIDGRFDSYERHLIDDYDRMRLARPGYLQLLDLYKIDWVFFPPTAPLVHSLAREGDWQVLYQDPAACILARRGRGPGR
ncbi:MAG: hypothetical protein JSS83_07435 [Cyanobacteria bacterium SZAS LIN-3]|nr:hypothetical protein [Cyanobacteria bacterium SZAS LIN-3]